MTSESLDGAELERTVAEQQLVILCQCGSALSLVSTGAPLVCRTCGRSYDWTDGVLMLSPTADPDGYPEELSTLLAEVEPRHFWFAERNRLIVTTMRRALGSLAGRSVLDIGCGTGFVTAALEKDGMRPCGLDMNLAGLRVARQRMNGLLVCHDAASVPFRQQFDVATLFDVIEHVDDDLRVLGEARAALRHGGAVVVTVPAHASLWTPTDDASGHKRRYTQATLRRALADSGFELLYLRYFNALLLPLQLLQRRLVGRRQSSTPEGRVALVKDALRVPPTWLNTLLELAMRADLPLGRLPGTFGASLIAVARRV